jgi:DNA-binding CsgD family transcriptional regulator
MAEGMFDGMLGQNRHSKSAELDQEALNPPESSPPASAFVVTAPDEPIYGGPVHAVGRELFVLSLPSPVARLPAVLTDAERHVAALVLDGLSNRSIAEMRGTSVRTVANQIASVFRKLNVTGRAELGDATASRRPRR